MLRERGEGVLAPTERQIGSTLHFHMEAEVVNPSVVGIYDFAVRNRLWYCTYRCEKVLKQ